MLYSHHNLNVKPAKVRVVLPYQLQPGDQPVRAVEGSHGGLFALGKVCKVRFEQKKALALLNLLCSYPSYQVLHLPKQELLTWPAGHGTKNV